MCTHKPLIPRTNNELEKPKQIPSNPSRLPEDSWIENTEWKFAFVHFKYHFKRRLARRKKMCTWIFNCLLPLKAFRIGRMQNIYQVEWATSVECVHECKLAPKLISIDIASRVYFFSIKNIEMNIPRNYELDETANQINAKSSLVRLNTLHTDAGWWKISSITR